MQLLRVHTSNSYDIMIGSDLLSNSGAYIRTVSSAEKAVIVTDDTVNSLYQPAVCQSLKQAGFQTETFVFPHGESSKSHATLLRLYDFLCDCNITRGDLLIALGGGVVGDLTGYCAATYLRGIDYIQIPTTLLAQIDSSVGGKTAVDTSRGKNLVGAFKQPVLVLCDIGSLDTLTPEIFSDGMAEAIKYGLIKDKTLFERIASGNIQNYLEEMIYRCIEIKANVVEADEFDRGERMLLNFGHTIGHAIERQFQYETYTHGSAVGIGMVYICEIFERQGLTPAGTAEKIRACLKQYRLPCEAEITPEQIFSFSVNDKKRNKDLISLVVLKEIGNAFLYQTPVNDYKALLNILDRPKKAVITPALLSGAVQAPPSKSYAHRALIAAALANGTSKIENLAYSQDIEATITALRALGAKITVQGSTAMVQGLTFPLNAAVIDCEESGSTLRFLIPIAAALGTDTEYFGRGRLPERPLTVYHECLANKGIQFIPQAGMPFRVSGRLESGKFLLDGSISSQFITGLLFALPLLSGDSEIILKTPLESEDYVKMTIAILELAGIQITATDAGYHIRGGQHYRAFSYTVEGDFSQAAFYLTAGAIGTPVACTGLNPNSIQGDKKILDILLQAGAELTISQDRIDAGPGRLTAFSVDGSNIPDLVPILSVLAACCEGVSEIHHISRLKYKESDRIHSTAQLLKSLGVAVLEQDDRLVITGAHKLSGGMIDSFHDHRIVMAAAIASLKADDIVTITHSEAVRKSFPDFFAQFNRLGGNADVIPME